MGTYMKKIWLIWNNRTRLTINKIVYQDESMKDNRKRLWGVATIIALISTVTVLFMNSFSTVLFKWIYGILNSTDVENVKWFSIFNLFVFLSFLISGIYDQLYRFWFAEDLELLVLSPISLNQLFVAKILERTYIKFMFFMLVLAVFFYQLSLFLNLSLGTGIILFGTFALQLVLVIVIRFIFISTMVIKKALQQSLLPFVLLFFSINIINAIFLIYLIKPFLKNMTHFFFYPFYLSIYESFFVKVVIKIASFTYFPHSMAVGVFKFSPFFALITYAIVIGILFKVADKRLNKLITEYIFGKMQEARSVRAEAKKKIHTDSIIFLVEKIPFIHPHVRFIMKKDLLIFTRDDKYRWKMVFVIMSLGLIGIVGAYYFIENNMDALSSHSTSASVFLSITVLFMFMNSIVSRFSIDSEGRSFRNLVILPVESKHIAMAKIISMLLALIPFLIIYFIGILILFKPNFLILSVIILSTMPVMLLIGLISTATFPNFSDESLLNLPSTRAKVMINILFGFYLLFNGILFYFISDPVISISAFVFTNCMLVIFLFGRFCNKIEGFTFNSFESLSELFD